MIIPVIVDESNREVFAEGQSPESASVSDVMIGAVDEETDTACGVLSAQSVPGIDGGHALSVSEVIVPDSYRSREVLRVLLRGVEDLASDLGMQEVYYTELLTDDDPDSLETQIEGTGFIPGEELPLYGFRLGDISVRKIEGVYGSQPLSGLSKDQWTDFLRDASQEYFIAGDRQSYDDKLSIFLFDDQNNVEAALLCDMRGEVLFPEHIVVLGMDEETLIRELAYWFCTAAKRRMDLNTPVQLFIPRGSSYRKLLMEITNKKAGHIGRLCEYRYIVPVGY